MNKQKASHQKRSQEPSYYDILGVPQDASADEIKTRYKALALKFHPDKEKSILAREAMISINHAYEVLSDEKMRFVHDLSLKISDDVPHCSSQTKRFGSCLGKIFNMRRVPMLIILALAISFLAGYQMELTKTDVKDAQTLFVFDNHHYFIAIGHEVFSSLPLCIPVFGVVWGLLDSFVMGFTGKAVIMMIPGLSAKVSGTFVLYFVVAMLLKLAAIQMGIYRSIALVVLIKRRQFTKVNKMFTQADIVLVALLSAIAGYVEHAVVNTH